MTIQLKKSIRDLKPYYVNDKEYIVKIDANEGADYMKYGRNLYPDSDARKLRQRMAEFYGCEPENIIVGNGSSEIINLVINACCEYDDKVLTFFPCFSMYEAYCSLCGAKIEYVKEQNMEVFLSKIEEVEPKVVILCNPNNPTGYVTSKEDVIKMLDKLSEKNITVLIDEAYMDFMGESAIKYINKYKNLIVARTMSKAFGLANIRVGCGIASEEVIQQLWAVKAPYNVNGLSQEMACRAFDNIALVREYIDGVIQRREAFSKQLKEKGFEVFPSGANFVLIKTKISEFADKLERQGVLIRSFGGELTGFYRITIGTEEEMKIVLQLLN